MGILLVLLVFVIIIVIHETAHTLASIWCGVGIQQFSVGFGPILKTWQTKKFPIHFRALFFLGGYITIKDKKNIEYNIESEEVEGLYLEEISLIKRIFIFSAGILANLLTAILARVFIFWFAPTDFVLKYGALQIIFTQCPEWHLALFYAIKTTIMQFIQWIWIFLFVFIKLIEPIINLAPLQNSGIIGAASAMVEVAQNTTPISIIWRLIGFFYYFSILVASFNILPFLPFDGGHIISHIIKKIFGENIATTIMNLIIAIIGFSIIGILLINILMSDVAIIWQLFS